MAPFVAQFRSLNDLSYAEYGHKQLKSRAVGRVAFAGDAAHSMSPQLGQACDTHLQLHFMNCCTSSLFPCDICGSSPPLLRVQIWACWTRSLLLAPSAASARRSVCLQRCRFVNRRVQRMGLCDHFTKIYDFNVQEYERCSRQHSVPYHHGLRALHCVVAGGMCCRRC